MFEKLAGSVFSKVLSKYFTEESLSRNNVSKTAQLGVWSGYISLQDLEVKVDVINKKLRQKGQPFELIHCSLRQVEITIPWAKLSSPINRRSTGTNGSLSNGSNAPKSRTGNSDDAVAVLVLDGVHVLFKTAFEFHDDELQAEDIRKRREALSLSESFAKSTTSDVDELYEQGEAEAAASRTYSEIFKKRITSGIFQEIVRKLHVHIRDLHVRIEDKASYPENAFAFGVTMESMHLQHDEDDDESSERGSDTGVVSKVAQMNHLAAYWNALDYGKGLPDENSILHEVYSKDKEKIVRALDYCIARRGSKIASPSKRPYTPKNTFVLLPVDGYLHAILSSSPKDLSSRPAVDIAIQLDSISTNLRDFQCVQMLKLYGERKNFQFVKKYRKFRPKNSVLEDTKAWWRYAASVIKNELKSHLLRWSWRRFHKTFATRARYMNLYERKVRSSLSKEDDPSKVQELTLEESREVRDLEDGVEGDLSVSDIILYRGLVNMRLGNIVKNGDAGRTKNRSGLSWWRETIKDATVDDSEAREEFERLLHYLDTIPGEKLVPGTKNDSLTAVSVVIQLEEIHFALFSPLHATKEESQLKRLHEKFLDFHSKVTRIGGSLKGDYKKFDIEFSIMGFVASEIWFDKSLHVIAKQAKNQDLLDRRNNDEAQRTEEESPLYLFSFSKNPVLNPEVSKELRMFLQPVEIILNPDCQWLAHFKEFCRELRTAPSVAKFWKELSVAHVNSLALGRLGLIAKAESAASNHENMDVDLNIHCPVVRVGMGDDGDLILDLGHFTVKTDKLAGVSRNKVNNVPLLQGEDTAGDETWVNNIDDVSYIGSSSVKRMSSRRKPMQRFLFSSSMSIGSLQMGNRSNQSFSGSFNLDDEFPQMDPNLEHSNREEEANLQELFYDKYQMRLRTGKITFSGESEVVDISSGFELRVGIQKSVMPTDHTLCQFKVNAVINKVKLVFNEALLVRFGVAAQAWKSRVLTEVSSKAYQDARIDMIGDLLSRSFDISQEDESEEIWSVSEVDENEFFDANEGTDSVAGETSGVWFEDNWIADAESIIDGGSKSSLSDRRGRRRPGSVSDMSSVSDQSAGRRYRNRQGNGYLSAENLARLEEAVGEDESVAESQEEKDDDSFYSVMSPIGQAQLLKDLQQEIIKTEEKIKELDESLNTSSDRSNDRKAGAKPSVPQDHRLVRKNIKIELERSRAELKALRALSCDLTTLLSDDSDCLAEKPDIESRSGYRIQQAKNAKALLRAKKKRDAKGQENGHNLVRNLNRQLLKGTLLVSKIQITLQINDEPNDGGRKTEVDFIASQAGLALLHQAKETKVYFSLDQTTVEVSTQESAFSNENSIHSILLFCGGSNDTLLPVHLPHLIAHSMEDRLVRGAVTIGKHRFADSSAQLARSLKIRLVVGDVETMTSHRFLFPVTSCLQRIKTKVEGSEPACEGKESMLSKTKTAGRSLNRISLYSDIAIRFASVRAGLSSGDQIVGAAAISEMSVRFLHITSTLNNKAQLDFRCVNAQILEIVNLEAGRGTEILGRRDPYSSLVQLRLRTQLVVPDEKSGWVVGAKMRERGPADNLLRDTVQKVRNIHVGTRINPLSILASPEAVSKLARSVRETRQALPLDENEKSKKGKEASLTDRLNHDLQIRWRFDLALRRVNIKFPDERKVEWGISDDVGSKVATAVTVVVSVQESSQMRGYISVRIGLTDISLIRSSDDWPIIESFSVIQELVLPNKHFENLSNGGRDPVDPLIVQQDSPLNEIEAIMARHGWDSMPVRKSEDAASKLVLKFSPLKLNISAPVMGLLAEISQSIQTLVKTKQTGQGSGDVQQDSSFLPGANDIKRTSQYCLQIAIESLEVQLHREADSKPIALATPLISFTLNDAAIDYSQGDQVTASVLIRDSALFDLSSGVGIRVVGEDPEARLDFPYFVRVKLYMHHGPQTVRLHINWGRIQCLVLPSFARSLLELKEELKDLTKVGNSSSIKKPDLFLRFLQHPNDVNLIVSADAETFECILASRDVIDYVNSGAREPCGVVTFRWKASLTVALALDCLQDSSIPWLTLNLDGLFTDEDDTNLFKDFSNKYLTRDSEFLTKKNAKCVHNFVNTFTVRVSHHLSKFQALRTNIARIDLSNSPRRGFGMKRICFKISQPAAGEQRITNPIEFMLLYRAAGSSIRSMQQSIPSDIHVEMAQLLHMRADFIDILLYIQSKGSGGFTDSFRASIKPALEMLKKDGRKLGEKKENHIGSSLGGQQHKFSNFLELMKTSPFISILSVEGFQMTCVPGGASRLNESPIIKFEMTNVLAGLAAVPMHRDLKLISGGGTKKPAGSPRQFISGSEVMNMTVGGWVASQVTGHYHNRSLVAWEPFIEPWDVNARYGIDLVEVFGWDAVVKQETKFFGISMRNTPPVLDHPASVSGSTGKDRFRDIGRLLRSPFQQSLQSPTLPDESSEIISHSDFCFLMLASSARSTIMSALYPSLNSMSANDSFLFSTMPSQTPSEWLQGFGQPVRIGDNRESDCSFAVSVLLTDKKPLNINLTGALIENVIGYLDHAKRAGSKTVVPHLIRNDTGMTIRFREVLGPDRAKRGENATKIILGNSSEVPLTLKRSLSQTCDPHRAYIYLEIGSFEDTVGRVDHDNFEASKGKLSSLFFFKAAAKIPVDAVGVHRYPLDRNLEAGVDLKPRGIDSRALGWIIVRVALRGNVKVVSVESPFILKSAADVDLLCEIRDQSGLSLLWRCLVPKDTGTESSKKNSGIVSLPADIVPFVYDGTFKFSVFALSPITSFSHEAEVFPVRDKGVEISTPPPFSSESFGKGLIGEEEIVLPTLTPPSDAESDDAIVDYNEKIHLTVCSVRIGSVSYSRDDASAEIPEQRMIFFRSPLVIKNCLALPIAVQIRVKSYSNSTANTGLTGNQSLIRRANAITEWEDLGNLDCGETINWTGSLSSDSVQVRVRFVGTDGDNIRRFPGWSSVVNIPAWEAKFRTGTKMDNGKIFGKMTVTDAENVALHLSVALEREHSNTSSKQPDAESIRHLCQNFSSATRVVSVFVPYWIVDETHQDLEFFAGSPVAGQLEGSHLHKRKDNEEHQFGNTMGLAELMDDIDFLNHSSRSEFDVLMIGEENSLRLTVRKRLARNIRNGTKGDASPWSDPIPLHSGQKTRHDLTVLTPSEIHFNENMGVDDYRSFNRLVLRSSIIDAADRFGGHLGTKLIHIVNRYFLTNDTGRDIEIMANGGSGSNILVHATSRPHAFHFDDSRPICFRFKEYGWSWTGLFSIRSNRREITMRVRHKMKGQTVIVTVEVRTTKKSATSFLVFRQSSHPPFRLENHTMHPLRFGQALSVLGTEETECDSLLLQYQNADYAWDEPEFRRRALVVKSSALGEKMEALVLGKFLLDRIAPGTAIKVDNDLFTAEVVADGPTRVLRISDASMPRVSSFRHDEFDYFHYTSEVAKPLTVAVVAKITHGIGISVVDFSPKELVYIRLEDIQIEKKTDAKKDDVSFSVGSIKVNNQLWVTPYPVLLKMGRHYDAASSGRRRNRRHDAISVSWRRSLNTHGGYGNVTLLDTIDITSEPVFVNVDGELATLLYRMIRHITDIHFNVREPASLQSRDEELKSLLAITAEWDSVDPEEGQTSGRILQTIHDPYDAEFMTTAAVAAKLKRSRSYHQPPTTPRRSQFISRSGSRKRKPETVSKVQHKFYVERLKISATKADLSWSGPLPGLVSSMLIKALTFERLPVRLRTFSSYHVYGSLQDHLQTLKSHYVSFWRIADLLFGLTSNPTFLFRAVLYTFREALASILDSWSLSLELFSTGIAKRLPRNSEMHPTYDDGTLLQETERRPLLYITKRAVAPFANATIYMLHHTSAFIVWLSSQLKCGSKGGNTQRTRGLVRSRNPRLFAFLDGHNLLVEYVEGENAGKALLSRVRMGLHLGEGYFFHAEGARQRKAHPRSRTDIDSTPLILMITSERVLLLTGKLDHNFCSVVWESYFMNIIHVAIVPADELSTFTYDEIIIWHLLDPEFSEGNQADAASTYTKSLISGIDVLHGMSIFVPRLIGKEVLRKMHNVDKRLGH